MNIYFNIYKQTPGLILKGYQFSSQYFYKRLYIGGYWITWGISRKKGCR